MGFLAHLAGAVSKESLPYLCKRCFIFPTQRAGYQFQQLLKNKFSSEAFIFPEVITIQNFIRRYADDAVVDEFTLLAELYPLHESLTNTQQAFDKFIPWGQQILKDFDEIDKYLVDAEKLFGAVTAQKQLEEDFGLSAETQQYLNDFLQTINERGGTYQQEFLKTWKVLGGLYPLFKDTLRQKRICYEGMAYREMTDKLNDGSLALQYDQIHFCGFNAFSYSEERLLQILSEKYHVETWWDVDEKFMDDPHHEAGNFLRRYKTMFAGDKHHWINEAVPREEKNISITGIASNIGQASHAAQRIATGDHHNTCIVLCDEQLLIPLLDRLPAIDINITMGYPVSHSPAFMIVFHLLNLYKNARMSAKSQAFYYKDVLAITDDPHLSGLFNDVAALKTTIPFSIPYISLHTLERFFADEDAAQIFRTDENAIHLLEKMIRALQRIISIDKYFRLPQELILKELFALRQQIAESALPVSANGLFRILPMYFSAARIPFDSNRESPVQVMGFLETRLQDFEQVIILSLNDDILPGTNRTNTFIPYNIRRSFCMPTFEQFDGINAYHFYRLLKRAKNIELVYNNAMSDNASEKSRFIRQVEFEWDDEQRPVQTQYLSADARLLKKVPQAISIPKTTEMKSALQQMAFSPSSIKLYLTCPVQFYLRYIAGIKEPEELQQDPDAAQFGNVLHNAMELFYRPLVGQQITAELVSESLKAKPYTAFLDEGAIQSGIPKSLFHGKNKLQWRILEKIGTLIIETDTAQDSFTLSGTETELMYEQLKLNNGTYAKLKGKIDRIDKLADGNIRIIDYKTGKVNIATFPKSDKDMDDFFEKIFNKTNTDHGITFQGMVYALLYKKNNPSADVIVGFYKAADLHSGIYYLNEGKILPADLLDEFEKRLSALLSGIIYENESFDRSEDPDAYLYSPYAELLGF